MCKSGVKQPTKPTEEGMQAARESQAAALAAHLTQIAMPTWMASLYPVVRGARKIKVLKIDKGDTSKIIVQIGCRSITSTADNAKAQAMACEAVKFAVKQGLTKHKALKNGVSLSR